MQPALFVTSHFAIRHSCFGIPLLPQKKRPRFSTFSFSLLRDLRNSQIHSTSTVFRKYMKTHLWFSRNGIVSRLSIATAVALIFAAAALALFAAFKPTMGFADAQVLPRSMPFPPIPPKKGARSLATTPPLAPNSPWQLLTNQPPVLDYTDCGPGNPIDRKSTRLNSS